jgi:hypothetical protein
MQALDRPSALLDRLVNTLPSQRVKVFKNYKQSTIYGYLNLRKLTDDIMEQLEAEVAPVRIFLWISYGCNQSVRQNRLALALRTRRKPSPKATLQPKSGWTWLSLTKLGIAEEIFYELRTASVAEKKPFEVEDLDLDSLHAEVDKRLAAKPLHTRKKRNSKNREAQRRAEQAYSKEAIKGVLALCKTYNIEVVKTHQNTVLQDVLDEIKESRNA